MYKFYKYLIGFLLGVLFSIYIIHNFVNNSTYWYQFYFIFSSFNNRFNMRRCPRSSGGSQMQKTFPLHFIFTDNMLFWEIFSIRRGYIDDTDVFEEHHFLSDGSGFGLKFWKCREAIQDPLGFLVSFMFGQPLQRYASTADI